MTGHERRHDPRHPLVLRVQYSDGRDFLGAWTENVSNGGFFVRTDEHFELGDRISCELSFPGLMEPIRVEGKVTWIRSGDQASRGVGVSAENETARRRLAELALLASRGDQPESHFRVVVAEDNPHIVVAYERVMRRVEKTPGFALTLHLAQNGHEALTVMREHPPNMLITDLYMPVLDGVSLIREMRADPALASVPILVVSSGADAERPVLEMLEVDAVLPKPLQFGQLLETIVSLLREANGGPAA